MTPNKFPFLSRAPITEAVLGIVTSDEETERYGSVEDGAVLGTKFHQRQEMHLFEAKIEQSGVQHQNKIIGFQYNSIDGRGQIQFRSNGFSCHNLRDYPGWESFIDEALGVFEEYKKLREKTNIQAVGIRFINTIKLADEDFPLKKSFNVTVHNSVAKSPFSVRVPSYRFLAEFKDLSCKGVVNFGAAEQGENPQKFILDIEIVFKDIANLLERGDLRAALEDMRIAKNQLFYSIIKPRIWRKYK